MSAVSWRSIGGSAVAVRRLGRQCSRQVGNHFPATHEQARKTHFDDASSAYGMEEERICVIGIYISGVKVKVNGERYRLRIAAGASLLRWHVLARQGAFREENMGFLNYLANFYLPQGRC
jgi:hypothetical protein